MKELKSTVKRQAIEISTLKTQLQKISKQYQEVEEQLNATKKRVDKQQIEIEELYNLQDQLEQCSRENTLEVHRVPEDAY